MSVFTGEVVEVSWSVWYRFAIVQDAARAGTRWAADLGVGRALAVAIDGRGRGWIKFNLRVQICRGGGAQRTATRCGGGEGWVTWVVSCVVYSNVTIEIRVIAEQLAADAMLAWCMKREMHGLAGHESLGPG